MSAAGSGKKKIKQYGKRKIMEELPDIPDMVFGKCVGSGFFSHVYEGTYKGNDVAIKVIERGSERATLKEIDFLKKLQGIEDVVQLQAAFKKDNMILVFDLIKGCSQEYLYDHLTVARLRFIIKHVVSALNGAHNVGIAHRDVKIGNVLITKNFDKVSLIDWGCANFISDSMSSVAGSRTCRSPEMLIGYRGYGKKCDAWAVGTMVVDILSEGDLPWRVETTKEMLITLSEYFGSKDLKEVAERYGLTIDEEILSELHDKPTKVVEDCFTERMKPLYTHHIKRIVEGLLQVDPEKRLTIEELSKSKYLYARRKKVAHKRRESKCEEEEK